MHEDAGALSEEAADVHHAARERAVAWARRAVEAGGLVRKPRSKKETALREYEERRDQTADRLIKRVVVPGEWFLVRWGGTRKGSGTFYTRPQLAVPTAQRTLQPLALDPPRGKDGQPDEKAPAAHWTPRSPEAILALKVCDPAMGSGSFLVAALRYLTDALYRSLFLHDRIQREGEHTLVTVLERGRPPKALSPRNVSPPIPRTRSSRSACAHGSSATWWSAASTASISIPWRSSSHAWRSGWKPWIATCPSSSWITS